MINKIFKRIFNRYSNIFKFLFYIKYLFLIFFIASLIFLLIPKFFNYEKKQIHIKNYLIKNYNLTIKENEKVQFNIFPLPNLEINKAILDFNKVSEIKTNKILIYPNIFRIYDFENFETLFNKPTNESLQLHISEYQKLKYLRFESSDIFPEGNPLLAYLLEFPKVFVTATSKEDYESVIKDVSQLGLPFFKRSFTFIVEPLFYVDSTKYINDFQAKTFLSFLTQSILLTNPDKELIESIVVNISKSFCSRKYTLKPNIRYFLCFFESFLITLFFLSKKRKSLTGY